MRKVKRCEKCKNERCVTKYKPNTNKQCIYCVAGISGKSVKAQCTKCKRRRAPKYFESSDSVICLSCELKLTLLAEKEFRRRDRQAYESPEHKVYERYKDNSTKVRKITFDLTQEEFYMIRSGDCVYCGSPGGSIDRIDSKQGYVLGNCAPCCYRCNMMKHTMTVEDFIAHIKKIAAFNS